MEDDFKSIPKLGAEVWQPLLDGKAITFGSPARTAHHEPKSVSSTSSVEDTQNQSKSCTDTAVGPPTQLLSILPRPTFSLNPMTRKPNPLLYNLQPVVIIRHQGWGTLKGVLIRPSHKQQWQLKLLSLGNNSSLPRKPWRMFRTIIVPRYSYTRVNWSPSKKIGPRLKW